MKMMFTRRRIAPIATALMALMLAGCVDEGRYYHDNGGYRDGGRIAPTPPRHFDRDRDYRRDRDWRRPPPRRDYDRQPPSIYDERGRGDDNRRYGYGEGYDPRRDRDRPRPPIRPRPDQPERPHYERGPVSIYQYSR